MSDLDKEIRELTSAYVAGVAALSDFSKALGEATWDVPVEDPAHDLTFRIELLLAESTSGHRSEESLRLELSSALGGVL